MQNDINAIDYDTWFTDLCIYQTNFHIIINMQYMYMDLYAWVMVNLHVADIYHISLLIDAYFRV